MDIDFSSNATDIVLEIEINPNGSGSSEFEDRYEHITGGRPVTGNSYQHQPNKWGTECRVYFNSEQNLSDEFTSLDIHVEEGKRPYRNNWQYRTNNSEFFWELIESGYHLGEN